MKDKTKIKMGIDDLTMLSYKELPDFIKRKITDPNVWNGSYYNRKRIIENL